MRYSKYISYIATAIIASLNVNTAMILIPADWEHIKFTFAFPVAFTACLLFDRKVGEEYSSYRLRLLAETTEDWIEKQKQRLTETPLGKIRYEEYTTLFTLFEAPFLKRSKLSLIHYLWIIPYLLIEFIIGVYLLQQREFDLPLWVAIAPFLAGLLNIGTGLLKGKLIFYPNALKELRKKYEDYEENLNDA